MQRIATQITLRVNLLFLSLIPSIALADNSAPEDYLANKTLVLEVRYCECQATQSDSLPSDLLPSFLEESRLLRVSVSSKDKGFASSSELSIGYELKPIMGSSGQFQFNYAGNYTTSNGSNGSNGSSVGNGELVLVQGQWVNLFGSQHENETGSQHSNVAVRLANPGGS
ncbi:hypothetical protein QUS15_17920 [Escherichia coli]|uniref:Uncharacterized protein n=1 Tax=Marinobacter persicus TaxID=930118 RepID=A0A1I3TKV9_9GAMM|nr:MULTISPECIES: hypothetical protein [Gammaproteobacteria]ELZ9638217.1 hypothetical protein [Proteus mirabilis]HEB5260845.1 hypothetical protein [Klebsiella pneumoniae]APC10892.1 hypothetical protein RB151_012070 [Providencia rettgeri]APC11261.1 hypothetical protein RB151_015810 [Providencia rettgeri]APC11488.1 hypothetical protein RB151_018080 [Providencia rettgeri]